LGLSWVKEWHQTVGRHEVAWPTFWPATRNNNNAIRHYVAAATKITTMDSFAPLRRSGHIGNHRWVSGGGEGWDYGGSRFDNDDFGEQMKYYMWWLRFCCLVVLMWPKPMSRRTVN
jgi:hypothetical protein